MFDRFGLQKLKNDLAKDALENIDETWNQYFVSVIKHNKPTLYTIGYEGISFEQYINKLLTNGVKVLCDVRRNPYSQKYGFLKNGLQEFLGLVGIEYIHIPELGITSSMRTNLNSNIDYYKIAFQIRG